jgi:ubiquinone/menaquinone biosynthesis C-methylase UbiE
MAVNWYERNLLPWLIHLTLRNRRYAPYRERVTRRARGRVLELGIGSGLNLRHYPAAAQQVVGVDPSARLLALAGKAERPPALELELHALDAARLPFPDASFDSVLMSWVLCSVQDVPAALAEVRRVLRPAGRVLFVEHGLAPDPRVRAWQQRLTPVWRHLAGNCHLDRAPVALLQAAGFRLERLDCAYGPGPRSLAYMYEGEATPA